MSDPVRDRVYPLPDSGEGRPAELVDLCLDQFVLAGFKRPEGPDASAFADAIDRYLFGDTGDADERLLTDPADGQCPRCRCTYPDMPGGRCKAPGHGMEFFGEVRSDGDWLVRHYFCHCGWGPFRFATRAVPEREQTFARLVGGEPR